MFPLTHEQIAAALNATSVDNVRLAWDGIQGALLKHDCSSPNVAIAALATYRVECGAAMLPINEYGGESYFRKMYDIMGEHPDRAERLGNTEPGDGALFHGRGPIQLTGRANYREYGRLVGIDLEANPDRALDPVVGTEILVLYFKRRHVVEAAEAQDWHKVRQLVNGGDNGLGPFLAFIGHLQAAINKAQGFPETV